MAERCTIKLAAALHRWSRLHFAERVDLAAVEGQPAQRSVDVGRWQSGREFHVLDLVAVERGSLPTGRAVRPDDGIAEGGGAGLPVIDKQARDSYRRRLAEVDDDIEEATLTNDIGRIELA